MALLLETNLGDLVIDLDIEGSPEICKNVLKLAKARFYTANLIYNVQPNRFCQLGDPQGDGSGGACIYGWIAALQQQDEGGGDGGSSWSSALSKIVLKSQQRFLKSNMGRPLTEEECKQKGRVVATEMNGIPDTIGSQLLITTCEGPDKALDGYTSPGSAAAASNENGENRQIFRSVGMVVEDENDVLDKIAAAYCDADGRPYADIRVVRALAIDDPFEDPNGMDRLLKERGVEFDENDRVIASPEYERPPEEKVELRIQADQVDPVTGEEDLEKLREQEEEFLKREDRSRAVVLEMLGDLPDADIKAPENVLFVCKLNPVTEDEDLELIFSRFDEKVKAEIIRDHETGNSLQYAFVEFTTKDQAVEAYFKMNNALVDDRRIKVDFSQSVAKVWNKYTQRMKNPGGNRSNQGMPKDPFGDRNRNLGNSKGFNGNRANGRGRNDSRENRIPREREFQDWHQKSDGRKPSSDHASRGEESQVDQFGRQRNWGRSKDDRRQKRIDSDEDRKEAVDGRGQKRRLDSSDDDSAEKNSSDLDDKYDRRSRSRGRSRERKHRKHRKHHKSKKDHKRHRRDQAPGRHEEREPSKKHHKREYADDSEDSRRGRRRHGDISEKKSNDLRNDNSSKDDSGSDQSVRDDGDHNKRTSHKEKHHDKHRHRHRHEDGSKRAGHDSKSDGEEERRKRKKDRHESRRRHKHRSQKDRHRSHHEKNSHDEDSDESSRERKRHGDNRRRREKA